MLSLQLNSTVLGNLLGFPGSFEVISKENIEVENIQILKFGERSNCFFLQGEILTVTLLQPVFPFWKCQFHIPTLLGRE